MLEFRAPARVITQPQQGSNPRALPAKATGQPAADRCVLQGGHFAAQCFSIGSNTDAEVHGVIRE